MPAAYSTTPLNQGERSQLEREVAGHGVVAVCSAVGVKPDTLRRARGGEGLRDHTLDKFRRFLHLAVDSASGLSFEERQTMDNLVRRHCITFGAADSDARFRMARYLWKEPLP